MPMTTLQVSNSGAAESSQLTEDVIVEILIRLPIKQIVQCKSVSKQWCRLISRPSFTFRQAQVQTFDNPACFYVLRVLFIHSFIVPVSLVGGKLVKHPNIIDLPPMETESDFSTHVLFPAGYGIYCLFEFYTGNVLLWNPTIKETKVLPPSPYFPSSVVHVYYFGTVDYKDGNFSYKVGRLSSKAIKILDGNRPLFSLSLELYSSKTKSWKHISDFSSGEYLRYPDYVSHCVNLNGRVHWVIQSEAEETYITTFDYETEVFGRIKAPSPVEVGDHYDKLRCIVTLYDEKFLCLGLFREMDDKTRYLDIWVMREYEVEDSWTKVFSVGPITEGMEVLGFSSKLQGVFSWHKNSYPTWLLLSDCETSIMKTCRMIGGKMSDQYMQVVEHVESLVSILD